MFLFNKTRYKKKNLKKFYKEIKPKIKKQKLIY